ncbi:MAG: glucose-6-phosphate isomerase family protein [bacterium]
MLSLIEGKTPDIRRLFDLKGLLYDKDYEEKALDFPLYYMYRDLSQNEGDREKIETHNLRYDITIIPPNMLGCEYVKTAGHFHPNFANSNLSYPEIYEVLEGRAIYLMQKDDFSDVYFVSASCGDKVIIPPNYGHITINKEKERLVMGNWVSSLFSSIYGPIKEKGGGAYFLTIDGWIKNERYKNHPPLRNPPCPDYKDIKKGIPMYSLVDNPSLLKFLSSPD